MGLINVLYSMVGRFQDGWLHVIWKWNKSVCAREYGGVVDGKECMSVMGEGA